MNRIVLGTGNITLVLEETENFDDSKKTIQSEIIRILSTTAKINILLRETLGDNDRNDSRAEEPPLCGKRAEEPPPSHHAKSGSFLSNSDAIFALGRHETTRLLYNSGSINDDVFRRCCQGHQVLLKWKLNLSKLIERDPEMFRKMCGLKFLDEFITEAEKKGDFMDIEKGIKLTTKQKRLKLQHVVKAATGVKQENLEFVGANLHDDLSVL